MFFLETFDIFVPNLTHMHLDIAVEWPCVHDFSDCCVRGDDALSKPCKAGGGGGKTGGEGQKMVEKVALTVACG